MRWRCSILVSSSAGLTNASRKPRSTALFGIWQPDRCSHAKITYHLLTEAEPFSEFYGGAISRWAGNVLRNAASSVVVCPSADHTWQFPPESLILLSGLKRYKGFRGRLSRLPLVFSSRRDTTYLPFYSRASAARRHRVDSQSA